MIYLKAKNAKLTSSRYIVVDYERSKFSVHQRRWKEDTQPDIQTILPVEIPLQATKPASRSVYIIPIAIASSVGGAIVLALLIAGILVLRERHRRKGRARSHRPSHSLFQKLTNTTKRKTRTSPRPTITRAVPPPLPETPSSSPSTSPPNTPRSPSTLPVSPLSPELTNDHTYFPSLASQIYPLHTPHPLQSPRHNHHNHNNHMQSQVHELATHSRRYSPTAPTVRELLGSPIPQDEVWVHDRIMQIERAMIRELQRERSEMLIREGRRGDGWEAGGWI